jgi:hypothetical protein
MSPVYYEYYSVNGSSWDTYDPATAPTPANLKISSVLISYNSSGTIATVTVVPPLGTAGSYGGSVAGSSTFNDPDFVVNSNSNVFTIGSSQFPLTPGSVYKLRIRAYSGSNQSGFYGDYFYETVAPPKPASVSSTTSTTSSTQTPPSSTIDYTDAINRATLTKILAAEAAAAKDLMDPDGVDVTNNQTYVESTGTSYATQGNRSVQTSLFKVVNNSPDLKKYSIALKDTGINTSYEYFSFGTSVFFSSNINNVQGSGGIGFFVSNNGMTGYFVLVQTTANLADTADKEVQIWKLVDGKKIRLNDSQSGTNGQALSGVLGGIAYKMDINVIASATTRVIDVYINNFKISALDKDVAGSTKQIEKVLPKTSKIAMFANTGQANFDYIYATPLTKTQFEKGLIQNIYTGKYGVKTLDFLYGDKILADKVVAPDQIPFLEEFGTVAREIKKIKIKYQDRPGDPLFTSVGINKFAAVLGQRLTSFGAEIYVINNSGTFVPLDDSGLHSFAVIGNYIVTSGQHEYVSNTLSETTVVEPAVFESAWIQTESDAKNLTKWIETQWSKQQAIVDMEIFGNPLISVGDVISVNYPKNNLTGTEKFIVTNVRNSFEGGLQTSITARSIFS